MKMSHVKYPATRDNGTNQEGDVVMVTGGSGFLGQHIIRLLHQKADYVKEIRNLDLKEYKNNLVAHSEKTLAGFSETKKMTMITGSVTDMEDLRKTLTGVKSVFHIAGLISYGTFPNIDGMRKVNVEGTSNVIKACLEAGVERLIYCSTIDVVIGFEPIANGDEQTTSRPRRFLFPGYPESKADAESLVLSANGAVCHDGKTKLKTIALRANVMYGEGDPYYITGGLRTAQKTFRTLIRVGDGNALFQPAYVGNTAWAFLCADRKLRSNPGVGRNAIFIPDDTPLQNTFLFMGTYLQNRGLKLSKFHLNYNFVYWSIYMIELVLWALSPIVKVSMTTASCSIRYINTTLYFNYAKAQSLIGYQPLYSPRESYQRSMNFYKTVEI